MPRYDDNIRGGGAHSPASSDRRSDGRRSMKSPLLDRHRRESPLQYQSSSSRLAPRDHDRHSNSSIGASSGGSRGGNGAIYHHRDQYQSSRSSHHHSREQSSGQSLPYKILCLSDLNTRFPDSTICKEIETEFARYGSPTVKLVYDKNEPIAYLYFQTYQDARDARRAKQGATILDRELHIEPIFNNLRKRSASPDAYQNRSSSSFVRNHSPNRRMIPNHRNNSDRYQLSVSLSLVLSPIRGSFD